MQMEKGSFGVFYMRCRFDIAWKGVAGGMGSPGTHSGTHSSLPALFVKSRFTCTVQINLKKINTPIQSYRYDQNMFKTHRRGKNKDEEKELF